MNNYSVIQIIDDVLIRLHPVSPPFGSQFDGPKQWLYLAEPKISHEIELVQLTTTLSDPIFPPSEEFDKKTSEWILEDGTRTNVPPPPKLLNGTSLPFARQGQVSYSVDYRLIQAFSGLRSVLLVLIDSCGTCAQDPDYVGNLPYTDSTTVLQEMSQWSEENFVPNAKFWKDWPLARFLKNPLPPVPLSWRVSPMSALFTGETGAYFRRLATYPWKRDDSSSYFRAVFGLAQSKRGFAEVPRSFVKRSMVKHSVQLSTPPTSSPDLDSVRLFARSFFEGFRLPSVFQVLPSFEASTKASVESGRESGGAREFLQHLISQRQGYSVDPLNRPLLRMVQPNASQVFEEHGVPPFSPSDWQSLTEYYTPAVSRSFLKLNAQKQVNKLAELDPPSRNLPVARVASVLEPLKVRLITAMDAVRSHVARPVQRSLWRFIRSSPVFRLVGEPVTEQLLHDLVSRHRKNGGGEDPFVSGDYSAATDGLDIRVSKVILEVILDCLSEEDQPYREYISSILYEQVITYPSWTKIDPIRQRNGQLMGSILSFPILCLANLYAYIESLPNSYEVLRSRKLMDRLAVLVNGDDILFRSPDSQYQAWLESIKTVGFVPSVGKNFRHPRFFTVNSVPIEYRPPVSSFQFWKDWSWADMDESPIPWKLTDVPVISIRGYLNVGLLTGQSKLTGRESLDALPLSGWHAGSVLEALNPPQAHKWFLKYHRQSIQEQTRFGNTTLNIFAHPLLGGLGFTVPPGVEPRFSPEQRRIAQSLFLSASYTYEGQESDYSLKSLVFLESDVAMPLSSLGRINRRVNVELYPLGTPLPEGYEPFTDDTGVQPLALAHGLHWNEVGTIEPSRGMKARCRLSSNRLRQLIKRFGVDTVDLHPLDKMTSFPFTPVKVVKSTFILVEGNNPNNASLFAERAFSRVYSQEIPFQDVIPPVVDTELNITVSEPEDWETQDISLYLTSSTSSSTTTSLPTRSFEGRKRRVLEKERNFLSQGRVYVRTALEQSYFDT